MKPKIALFKHHPECSTQSCNGIITALSDHYNIKLFSVYEVVPETFKGVDIIAFPGGIGDSSTYHNFFGRKAGNIVADFVEHGGKYLGICMGAYWASHWYFDLLDGVTAKQYIKRPRSERKRSYSTTVKINWLGEEYDMFFYDGCALVGDPTKFDTFATYKNGDPAAIIQNGIGLIGVHPESEQSWYKNYPYLKNKWHGGRDHAILLDFVNTLMLY